MRVYQTKSNFIQSRHYGKEMKIMPLLSYSYIPIYLVIEKFTQQGMEYSRCALQKNQTESNFVYIRNRDIMDIGFVTKIYPKAYGIRLMNEANFVFTRIRSRYYRKRF